ncbi:MAG TPA: hypothetical protein VLA06_02620 [Woeseiaceae bacterium]|nr:hypothetical protein [Woeseiaceae bacterium]
MKRVILVSIAALGFATHAGAASVDEVKYDGEVRSCVAEIRNHVDYAGASHVRHDVVLVKPKLLGYVMRIDTAIYTETEGGPVREYASYCVVNGNHRPLKFEISETLDNS